MEDVKYHILYWEGESPHGIFLETERELTAQSRKRDGPGRCFCCGHVADSWRHRMDNVQISLRLCEDPNGKHFRQDVDGFHLLSPKMGISYHLSDFGNYLWSMDEKCPTENHIIGTALKVLKKEVLPTTCGVKVSTWNTAEGWQRWLEDKVCELRTGAEQRGGVSVGLILDKDGFEVGSCGISHPYFAHTTEKPIREILVALGGPGGIDDAVMKVLEQRGDGHGLHLGLMRVKLPGGLHHSCVALNDLLQFHDKGYLYPIMEDNRFLRNSYQKWRTHLSRAVSAWAEPGSSAEEKTQALRHFIRNFQSQQTAKHAKNGDARKGFTWPQVVAAPATYVATVRDAENYVSRLQAHGTLPSGKWPFRLRGCLESIEPGKAIDILRVVQLKKVEALCKGYDYDPWHELCEDLDAAIAEAALAPRPAPPRAPAPTPKDVQTLLVQCREGLERFETKEDEGRPPGATQLELGALNRLSCRDAMLMLNRLRAQKPHVLQKRPADARSTAGLAQHAAMFHALRSGRSGLQLHSALQGMLERKGQRQKRTRESYAQQSGKRPRGGQWKPAEDKSRHWQQQRGPQEDNSQDWPQQRGRAEDNSRHRQQQRGPEEDNSQDWPQQRGRAEANSQHWPQQGGPEEDNSRHWPQQGTLAEEKSHRWPQQRGRAEDNSQHWPQQGGPEEDNSRHWPQQGGPEEDNSRHWPQQRGPEEDNSQDWPQQRGRAEDNSQHWPQQGGWSWSWRSSWHSNWEDDGDDDQVPIGQGRNRWPSEPLCPAPGPAHPPPSNLQPSEPSYPPLRRTPAPPPSAPPYAPPSSSQPAAAPPEPSYPPLRRTPAPPPSPPPSAPPSAPPSSSQPAAAPPEPSYPPLRRTPAPPPSPPPSAPPSAPPSSSQLAAAPPEPAVRRAGRRRCLNAHCYFLAHENEETYGGFCCIACGKWSKENYKKKTHHGSFCKREPAEGLV